MKNILIFILLNFVICLEIGDTPEKFYLRDLNNEDYFLSDELEKDSPILLSFFATWCAPCRKELPQLDTLSTTYKDISFVYIATGSGNKALKSKDIIDFKYDLGLTQRILLDKYGRIYDKFSPNNILPLTILISNNKIIYLSEEFDEKTSISDLINQFKKVVDEE